MTHVKGKVANLEVVVNELKAKLEKPREEKHSDERAGPRNQSAKQKPVRTSQPPNFKQTYNTSGLKNQKQNFQNQREVDKFNQKPEKFGRLFQQTCLDLNREENQHVHPSRMNNLLPQYQNEKPNQRPQMKQAPEPKPKPPVQKPTPTGCSSYDEEDDYCIVPMTNNQDCAKSQASIPAVNSSQIEDQLSEKRSALDEAFGQFMDKINKEKRIMSELGSAAAAESEGAR